MKINTYSSLCITGLLACLSSPASAQMIVPASFDTTMDFWSGAVGSDWSAQKQAYASNSGKWDIATEEVFHQEYDWIGMVIQFDVSGLTPELVNTPGFQATLDVMFQGFASDENRYAAYNPDPSATPGAGDGLIYMDVYRVLTPYDTSANRWMADSATPGLLNWDGSTPTSLTEARAAGGNFNDAGQLPILPESQTIFQVGVTQANTYGELLWDVTDLVVDWVNGTQENYGLFVHVNKNLSWGEQINLLTMETDDRPAEGISAPGDASPLLRVAVIPEPRVYALAAGAVVLLVAFVRRRLR